MWSSGVAPIPPKLKTASPVAKLRASADVESSQAAEATVAAVLAEKKALPKHPAALNGLGQLALAQRKYKEAEKYLLKAAPQAPAAWFGLARLFLLEGKFDDAKKWAKKVVDTGQADDIAKEMLKAAEARKLDDELRQKIEPPAAEG